MKAAAVLFDLDGTLLDTAPDMVGALNLLRVEHGLEPLGAAGLRQHVSHGAMRLVKMGFPAASGPDFEQLRLRFLALYAANLAGGTRPFPGIEQLLQVLETQNIPWGVVTNKPGWLTDPLLAALGLLTRACCVVSGDTVAERKPHPMPLLHAATLARVPATECVYVGDTERDIIAGRAAGMQTVVAAYGYLGADDEPVAWAANGIVQEPSQINEWLELRHGGGIGVTDMTDAGKVS